MARRRDSLKKVCGCGRRQRTSCRHPWHFDLYTHGRRGIASRSRPTRTDRSRRTITAYHEARDLADQLRAEIRHGAYRGPAWLRATARLTFGAFADLWHTREGLKLAAARDHRYRLGQMSAFVLPGVTPPRTLGAKPLDTITLDDLEAYRDARKVAGRSAVTVTTALSS